MVDINYGIKITSKEEKYLFIQTVFYLVCRKIVENYRLIIKDDILKQEKLEDRTKFKSMYMGRFDGKVILVDIFKLLNPYAVSDLLTLYNAIDKNWNKINNRTNLEITREMYFFRCLIFLRQRLNFTKQDKPKVDLFFQQFTKGLNKYQASKFSTMKLPLYIQFYNEDEIKEVIFFLENIVKVFGFDSFMVKLSLLVGAL